MKLYNKSGPGLIVDATQVISGGRFSEHDSNKGRKNFDVDSDIEVTDAYGEKLLRMYPRLKQTDRERTPEKKVTRPRKVAKKKIGLKKKR